MTNSENSLYNCNNNSYKTNCNKRKFLHHVKQWKQSLRKKSDKQNNDSTVSTSSSIKMLEIITDIDRQFKDYMNVSTKHSIPIEQSCPLNYDWDILELSKSDSKNGDDNINNANRTKYNSLLFTKRSHTWESDISITLSANKSDDNYLLAKEILEHPSEQSEFNTNEFDDKPESEQMGIYMVKSSNVGIPSSRPEAQNSDIMFEIYPIDNRNPNKNHQSPNLLTNPRKSETINKLASPGNNKSSDVFDKSMIMSSFFDYLEDEEKAKKVDKNDDKDGLKVLNSKLKTVFAAEMKKALESKQLIKYDINQGKVKEKHLPLETCDHPLPLAEKTVYISEMSENRFNVEKTPQMFDTKIVCSDKSLLIKPEFRDSMNGDHEPSLVKSKDASKSIPFHKIILRKIEEKFFTGKSNRKTNQSMKHAENKTLKFSNVETFDKDYQKTWDKISWPNNESGDGDIKGEDINDEVLTKLNVNSPVNEYKENRPRKSEKTVDCNDAIKILEARNSSLEDYNVFLNNTEKFIENNDLSKEFFRIDGYLKENRKPLLERRRHLEEDRNNEAFGEHRLDEMHLKNKAHDKSNTTVRKEDHDINKRKLDIKGDVKSGDYFPRPYKKDKFKSITDFDYVKDCVLYHNQLKNKPFDEIIRDNVIRRSVHQNKSTTLGSNTETSTQVIIEKMEAADNNNTQNIPRIRKETSLKSNRENESRSSREKPIQNMFSTLDNADQMIANFQMPNSDLVKLVELEIQKWDNLQNELDAVGTMKLQEKEGLLQMIKRNTEELKDTESNFHKTLHKEFEKFSIDGTDFLTLKEKDGMLDVILHTSSINDLQSIRSKAVPDRLAGGLSVNTIQTGGEDLRKSFGFSNLTPMKQSLTGLSRYETDKQSSKGSMVSFVKEIFPNSLDRPKSSLKCRETITINIQYDSRDGESNIESKVEFKTESKPESKVDFIVNFKPESKVDFAVDFKPESTHQSKEYQNQRQDLIENKNPENFVTRETRQLTKEIKRYSRENISDSDRYETENDKSLENTSTKQSFQYEKLSYATKFDNSERQIVENYDRDFFDKQNIQHEVEMVVDTDLSEKLNERRTNENRIAPQRRPDPPPTSMPMQNWEPPMQFDKLESKQGLETLQLKKKKSTSQKSGCLFNCFPSSKHSSRTTHKSFQRAEAPVHYLEPIMSSSFEQYPEQCPVKALTMIQPSSKTETLYKDDQFPTQTEDYTNSIQRPDGQNERRQYEYEKYTMSYYNPTQADLEQDICPERKKSKLSQPNEMHPVFYEKISERYIISNRKMSDSSEMITGQIQGIDDMNRMLSQSESLAQRNKSKSLDNINVECQDFDKRSRMASERESLTQLPRSKMSDSITDKERISAAKRSVALDKINRRNKLSEPKKSKMAEPKKNKLNDMEHQNKKPFRTSNALSRLYIPYTYDTNCEVCRLRNERFEQNRQKGSSVTQRFSDRHILHPRKKMGNVGAYHPNIPDDEHPTSSGAFTGQREHGGTSPGLFQKITEVDSSSQYSKRKMTDINDEDSERHDCPGSYQNGATKDTEKEIMKSRLSSRINENPQNPSILRQISYQSISEKEVAMQTINGQTRKISTEEYELSLMSNTIHQPERNISKQPTNRESFSITGRVSKANEPNSISYQKTVYRGYLPQPTKSRMSNTAFDQSKRPSERSSNLLQRITEKESITQTSRSGISNVALDQPKRSTERSSGLLQTKPSMGRISNTVIDERQKSKENPMLFQRMSEQDIDCKLCKLRNDEYERSLLTSSGIGKKISSKPQEIRSTYFPDNSENNKTSGCKSCWTCLPYKCHRKSKSQSETPKLNFQERSIHFEQKKSEQHAPQESNYISPHKDDKPFSAVKNRESKGRMSSTKDDKKSSKKEVSYNLDNEPNFMEIISRPKSIEAQSNISRPKSKETERSDLINYEITSKDTDKILKKLSEDQEKISSHVYEDHHLEDYPSRNTRLDRYISNKTESKLDKIPSKSFNTKHKTWFCDWKKTPFMEDSQKKIDPFIISKESAESEKMEIINKRKYTPHIVAGATKGTINKFDSKVEHNTEVYELSERPHYYVNTDILKSKPKKGKKFSDESSEPPCNFFTPGDQIKPTYYPRPNKTMVQRETYKQIIDYPYRSDLSGQNNQQIPLYDCNKVRNIGRSSVPQDPICGQNGRTSGPSGRISEPNERESGQSHRIQRQVERTSGRIDKTDGQIERVYHQTERTTANIERNYPQIDRGSAQFLKPFPKRDKLSDSSDKYCGAKTEEISGKSERNRSLTEAVSVRAERITVLAEKTSGKTENQVKDIDFSSTEIRIRSKENDNQKPSNQNVCYNTNTMTMNVCPDTLKGICKPEKSASSKKSEKSATLKDPSMQSTGSRQSMDSEKRREAEKWAEYHCKGGDKSKGNTDEKTNNKDKSAKLDQCDDEIDKCDELAKDDNYQTICDFEIPTIRKVEESLEDVLTNRIFHLLIETVIDTMFVGTVDNLLSSYHIKYRPFIPQIVRNAECIPMQEIMKSLVQHYGDNYTNFCCNMCRKWIPRQRVDDHIAWCNQTQKKILIDDYTAKEESCKRSQDRPVASMPGTICYICGRYFTKYSILIHEKMCLDKWMTWNNQLPLKHRKPIPQKPAFSNSTIKGKLKEEQSQGNKYYKLQDALNELLYQESLKHEIDFENC